MNENQFINNQLFQIAQKSLLDSCTHEIIQTKDHTLFPFLYGKYALMITEPEPENDIHIVFDAFEKFNQYPIIAVGNWKANAYGQALYERYQNSYLIKLIHPQIQLRTLNMLRTNCFIYIDSHHLEDQSASLIEAMYMQLPIIAYASTYNTALTENNAMYFKHSSDLIEILYSIHPTKAANYGVLMKQCISSQLEKLRPIH
jgi:ABC-type molybdate transport system substrate-binding protein